MVKGDEPEHTIAKGNGSKKKKRKGKMSLKYDLEKRRIINGQ